MANASGRILVVEDNPALLGVIALSLRNAGLDVVTAETGIEAWRMLEQHAIDLVVTDFNMPGMSGGSLCMKMRDTRGTPDTDRVSNRSFGGFPTRT